jgi:probable F420-dependent oxidoreductase
MSDLLIGLGVSTSADPGADPVADATTAERLGFDFVSASDHLHGDQPTYEPWTMLSWIAAATTRVAVATRVLAVPYRSPAVIAKMAATLDGLSGGGRLILGLGGGYSDEEFHAFGLGTRSPRDKVDGMEEAIRIIRGLWSQPRFTFHGRLYRTDEATLEPRPGRIPIWLGTYGPRALAVTGRLADGWIPSLGFAPAAQVEAMRERVLAAAREAGRDPAEITCAYNVTVRVDDKAEDTPDVVAGPADLVCERLAGFAAMGFTALNLMPVGPDAAEQVERLGREVLPVVRAAVRA